MALAPGTRLGPYEITAHIGAGGMGEVYRARDARLDRDVALKLLPDAFARDPERLIRFQREARVLASLNHPHIAHLYGLEETTGAIVMELVEGPTLADRLARGRIPLDEALPLARQIAEALEAAHEQGVIHRDLKPANVKVKEDGTIKVLDFGLAKILQPAESPTDVVNAPTITSPAMTQQGIILGTAAYMAPEQAKGRPADKRSDMWAFGCVLFEMLAGQRPFDGDDVTDILGAVVRLEPDWQALPNDVPPAVRALLRTCLQKDRRKRTVDAATALFVLDNAASLVERPGERQAGRESSAAQLWRWTLPVVVAVLITAGAGWYTASRLPSEPTRPVGRFVIRAFLARSRPAPGAHERAHLGRTALQCRHARESVRDRTLLPVGIWPVLRRVAGRPPLPDDQERHGRPGRDARVNRRRDELVRRAEAPSADQLRIASLVCAFVVRETYHCAILSLPMTGLVPN